MQAVDQERYWAGRVAERCDGLALRRIVSEEPWLDKRGAADHFAVCTRTIENWMAAGMQHHHYAGRVKLRASEVERWLLETGRIERKGDRR